MKNIIVVGCGISGLSSGLLLARAGFDVKIISKNLPPHTTSNKAAAFWSPYYANGDRVARWAMESYLEYEKLSQVAESGVSMTKLHRFRKKDFAEAEDWEAAIPEGRLRILEKEKLPAGYDEGFEVEVPLIETQIFLPYLMNEFRKERGKIFQHEVKSLDELMEENTTLINCSGMGARTLVNDNAMIPVKGQVVMMDVHLNIPIILDEREPTYIVQRKDGCIVGGTREENVFSETTDEATLTGILDRASKFFPELTDAKRITQWAALRPYRYEVRLEWEAGPDLLRGKIIHNYGHGGSGFTLAWGCAQEVLQLAREI
ncbi:MAG TPA: FAD-dependent oxidoreductase [Chitinophagales bacterium]|nr:FAD-dependent oxidoreductase [Chitinophagales bacterium]